eukprot:m.921116 g.921116  ORF g.921116 m.921116 type:complete len:332 (+) comp79124_c0_seq1:243-1238(+)
MGKATRLRAKNGREAGVLRVKVLAVGSFAALGMVVWWLWSAGMNEPAMAMPDTAAPGALPEMQRTGTAPGPATSASQSLPRDIFEGVHQRPGSGGGDLVKRYYRVNTEDMAKVQRALAGSSAAEALQAAQLLTRCANSDRDVQGLFEARDQQPWILSKLGLGIGIDKMIENAQSLQRDCQVFNAATHARTGALFEQAYVGGASNSAPAYLRWLQRDGAEAAPPALTADLQRYIRGQAESADAATLMLIALTNDPEGLGISAVDRVGFERAWRRIHEAEQSGDVGLVWGALQKVVALIGDKPLQLTPEQEAQADALAKRVFTEHQRRQRPVS